MRTHVTFQASFPKEGTPDAPAGQALAQHLAAQLGAAGYTTEPPQVYEGYAYQFGCRQDRQAFAVFTALVDDGVQEWIVYAEPKVAAVGRLLQKVGIGGTSSADSPALEALCTAIHTALRSDPGVRSIRWYTTAGWDENPDGDWSRTP